MSSGSALDMPLLRAMYGSTLVGTLVGTFLSGIVLVQVYLYIRMYPQDPRNVKVMVALIWFLDFLHTFFICVASWMDLIERFGDWKHHDRITWGVGASVALTALVTFLVLCFFIYRIYRISNGNKALTIPLAFLALFRLVTASVSTSEMIRLSSYSGFVKDYGYVFTMGLSSAVALDIMVTAAMCFYLRRNKSDFSTLNEIIDTLIVYTVQTGMITCCTTIASLACWVTMPNNLIFLGLHFTIPKLYANSFLAMLNSRVTLAETRNSSSGASDRRRPIMLSDFSKGSQAGWRRPSSTAASKALEISVQTTVDRDICGGEVRSRGHCYEVSDEEIAPIDDPKSTVSPVQHGDILF